MERTLWLAEDENDLKKSLSQIDAANNLDELNIEFSKALRLLPRYHDLLKAAKDDKHVQITQVCSVAAFDERKNKIRRKWLLLFTLNYFVCFLYALVEIFNERNTKLEDVVILTAVMGFIVSTIYHFAYKKSGTWLLSGIVFGAPIQLLSSFGNGNFSLFYLLTLIVFGFYWVNCFRLRQLNYEFKGRMQLTELRAIM